MDYKAEVGTKVSIIVPTLVTGWNRIGSENVSCECAPKADESNFYVEAQWRVPYENYAPFERSKKLRS